MIFAAEAQQRQAVLREGHRMAADFFDGASVVENRVPQQIREKDFQQRSQAADFSGAASEGVDDFLGGFFKAGDEDRAALALSPGKRFGEFDKGFGLAAGREIINLVRWIIFLMQRGDGVGDEIHGADINAIAGEEDEGADHVELIGFGPAAIAQDDAGAEDGALNVWQQLANHVLAEFFGAGVRIVVGTVPIYCSVFLDYFVGTVSCDCYGADVAKAAQAVLVASALSELDDFESATKINVEAAFFGFAIQGCGAVDYGVCRADELRVVVIREAEMRVGKVAAEDADARLQKLIEAGEIEMQLESAPEAFLRFLFTARADEKIQRVGMAREQIRRDVRADISGGTGQEDSHSD